MADRCAYYGLRAGPTLNLVVDCRLVLVARSRVDEPDVVGQDDGLYAVA